MYYLYPNEITQDPLLEIPAKPIQDTVQTSKEVPEIFSRKVAGNSLLEAQHASALLWIDCPVIDFALLSSPSPVSVEEELRKLHSALVTWGCFQLVNHGMGSSFLDEVRDVSKRFFQLPTEERMRYARGPADSEGYGNDIVLSNNVPHNWNDLLYLTVYPEDERKIDRWPENPRAFRSILDKFTTKVEAVHEMLLQAMAECLSLETICFNEEYGGKTRITARVNFYPTCPFPELVHASRAHSDASAMTILLQDKEVEGLQVLKDDKWFKVPIISDALFINVGDQMEIMSNGIFKGAVHRVVANSERERISLAMFCAPGADKEISPLKELVNKDQPPLYRTVQKYEEAFFSYHPKAKGLSPQ